MNDDVFLKFNRLAAFIISYMDYQLQIKMIRYRIIKLD